MRSSRKELHRPAAGRSVECRQGDVLEPVVVEVANASGVAQGVVARIGSGDGEVWRVRDRGSTEKDPKLRHWGGDDVAPLDDEIREAVTVEITRRGGLHHRRWAAGSLCQDHGRQV